MDSIELFHQDGKSSKIFYCSKCRIVWPDKEKADRCCEPTKCQYCGKESGRQHYLACGPCDRANEIKRETARFEKAEKLVKWDSWVYLDGVGSDGFFESVSHFSEIWECDHDENEEIPDYVWACKKIPFAAVDFDRIIERICEEAYEDFDSDSLKGVDELKAAVEKFNEANKDIVSYEPDYSKAILLK